MAIPRQPLLMLQSLGGSLLLAQVWRGLDALVWLARFTLRIERRRTLEVCLLLVLAMLLQGALAISLVVSANLLMGRGIGHGGWTAMINDRTLAIALAVGLILVTMLVVAAVTYATAVRTRALGRAIQTSIIARLIDLGNDTTALDGKERPELARLFTQASLHSALAAEGILRLSHPVSIMLAACYVIISLDRWLLPFLFVVAVPILPLFARESRRLMVLSNAYYGDTAQHFGRTIMPVIHRFSAQNVTATAHAGSLLGSAPMKRFLDDYDGVLLANERMALLTGLYRPIVIIAVLGYLVWSQSQQDGSGIAVLPILFGVFYLSVGFMAFASQVSSLLRLLPQVNLVRSALEAPQSEARAPAGPSQGPGAKWLDLAAGDVVLCDLPTHPTRATVKQLALGFGLHRAGGDGQEPRIAFVTRAALLTGLRVRDVLPSAQRFTLDEIKEALSKLGASAVLTALSGKTDADAVVDDGQWEALSVSDRAIVRLLQLAAKVDCDFRLADTALFNDLDPGPAEQAIRMLEDKPLLLVPVKGATNDWATKWLILAVEGTVRMVSRDEFEVLHKMRAREVEPSELEATDELLV